GAHIDGMQGFCVDNGAGGKVSENFLLLEGNTYRDTPDHDSHFVLINTLNNGPCQSTTVVARQNLLNRVGDASYGANDPVGFADNHKFYNNTVVIGAIGTNEHATVVMNGVTNGSVINN